jgi:hypothetical protein
MAWMHPLAVEHRRKMFTRQDAWRLAPPGTPEARMPGYLHPSARIAAYERAQQETAAREAAAWEADQRELLQIRREFDELKREVAVKRAAWEREDEAARIKCDIAWERFVQTYKRYAAQQKAVSIASGTRSRAMTMAGSTSGKSRLPNSKTRSRLPRECHQRSKLSAKGSTTATCSTVKWSGRLLAVRRLRSVTQTALGDCRYRHSIIEAVHGDRDKTSQDSKCSLGTSGPNPNQRPRAEGCCMVMQL